MGKQHLEHTNAHTDISNARSHRHVHPCMYSNSRYVKGMRADGEWAGQPEMLAVAWDHQVSIWVHCDGGQPTYLIDAGVPNAKVIHISYHEGIHFNAVYPSPEAETAAAAAAKATATNSGTNSGKSGASGVRQSSTPSGPTANEKLVMSSTGCDDLDRVRRALEDAHDDAASAIESIIDEDVMAQSSAAHAADQVSCSQSCVSD